MSGVGRKADRTQRELDVVLRRIEAEFPEFRVVSKRNSCVMRGIDVALRVLTFGAMATFMTEFVTTIGTTVYVPDKWDSRSPLSRAVVFRHEAVHMRQVRRLGFLVFAVLYLLWPLPFVFATGRRNLEEALTG